MWHVAGERSSRSPIRPRGRTGPKRWWRPDAEPIDEIVPEAAKAVAPTENRFLPGHLSHPVHPFLRGSIDVPAPPRAFALVSAVQVVRGSELLTRPFVA